MSVIDKLLAFISMLAFVFGIIYLGKDYRFVWILFSLSACELASNKENPYALREQGKEQNKWISVKERLPDKNTRVLVTFINPNGDVGIDDCFYTGQGINFSYAIRLKKFKVELQLLTGNHYLPRQSNKYYIL